ncbi:ribosomal-protein-alanine N-acetyltransferase [Lactobacillus sp. PV037]|uniref:ribosomal protein S18-alanine N-acetyltransferase n=1 Tax=unclassified Lactobacillus TaxID=2620435 RepID=UPI002240CBAD|nr:MULTISPECIES: ribosomal protein S18-alanine N-acetyltransferase [unclassified Lactobacillus]QNQ81891.1 ribosomal-protein-alanine N-acetyltransferase [Lactobacillus sp. PV012]QNQ84457.1 ribosomal-protein-alanine N-acetyltransferase [Lactobacillus sp. PV037]
MWKKFNKFFHAPTLDLSFAPFAFTCNQKVMQVMPAKLTDISELIKLEKEIYTGKTPWNKESFESELKKETNTLYIVVYYQAMLVAFIGMRLQGQEGHITNIGVKPAFQRLGIGSLLLRVMTQIACKNHAVQMTLEVRTDNLKAQQMYRRFGFVPNFIRKNYYLQEKKDALSMIKQLRIQEQEKVN